MISEDDLRALRFTRCELTKRGIDITRADLRVQHGILQLHGWVAKAPEFAHDSLKFELEHVMHHMRSRPEVREIVLDVHYVN